MEINKISSFAISHTTFLWSSKLTAHPYVDGDEAVQFSSLLPDGRRFVELFRDQGTGLEAGGSFYVAQLLTASKTFGPLKALLGEGLLSWERRYAGGVTLAHLICAFGSSEAHQLMQCSPPTPKSNVWSLEDNEGRKPLDVCISEDLLKRIKASKWFKGSSRSFRGVKDLDKPLVKKPLSADVRSTIFRLASTPGELYRMIVLLREFTFDVNKEKNGDGDLLIHAAIRGGEACLPILFVLVNQFHTDLHLANDQGLTPLCLAAVLGKKELCEVLICIFGAGVNSSCSNCERSPLHYASQNNREKVARMLLERGANPSQEDLYGHDPASLARWHRSNNCLVTITSLAQNRIANLSAEARAGMLNVQSLFHSDYFQFSDKGLTLLMVAVLGNHPALVKAMVNSKHCDVNLRQMMKVDALGLAGIHLDYEEHSQMTALSFAAEKGHVECLKALLNGGADPSIEDSLGRRPMDVACIGGHVECVRLILEAPELRGLTGLQKALSYAQDTQNSERIVLLLRKAISKRQDEVLPPKIHEAAKTGDCSLLEDMFEEGDNVHLHVSSCLLEAVKHGHLQLVQRLIELNGSVVCIDRLTRCSPLHVAVQAGNIEMIRFLCQFCCPKGAELCDSLSTKHLNINGRNSDNATALELAISHGNMEAVRELLHCGAASGLPDSMGHVHGSVTFNGIQRLLDMRIEGMSQAILKKNALNSLRELWHHPSDFNLRDCHGDHMLMIVARCPHRDMRDVIQFLLQEGAMYTKEMAVTIPSSSSTSPRSGHPLEDSCYESDREGLPKPLHSLGETSTQVAGGNEDFSVSAPTRAALCAHSGVVRMPNLRDGCTALHRAVESGQHLTIPMLIEADPLVKDMQNHADQTALHVACNLTNKKCVAALLKCNVNAGIHDRYNRLPEDLVPASHSRLKKKVIKQRCQQTCRTSATRRVCPQALSAPVDIPRQAHVGLAKQPLRQSGMISARHSGDGTFLFSSISSRKSAKSTNSSLHEPSVEPLSESLQMRLQELRRIAPFECDQMSTASS